MRRDLRPMELEGVKIQRQIRLPLLKAVEISIKSLKIRFGRSLITMGGIFLGIAFLTSIFTSTTINMTLAQKGSLEVKAKLTGSVEVEGSKIWLVTLSLLVCVVGITNSMLMAVTERYKEIGTMKCLGALDRFILELFLIESGFQGLVSATAGAIAGSVLMIIVSGLRLGGEVFTHLPTLAILKYMLLSIGIGLILSVLGSIYPAYRAAKMAPAEAMRVEV